MSSPPTSPFRMNRSNYSASGSGSGSGSTSPRRRLRGASISNDNDISIPNNNNNYNSNFNNNSNHNYSNSHKTKTRLPPGFLAHKPKQTPIGEMALWELESRYNRNARVLGAAGVGTRTSNPILSSSSSSSSPSFPSSSSSSSPSSYIQRLTAEQAAIEEQLVEVHGMEVISARLRNTRIGDGGAGAIGGGGGGGFGGGFGGGGGGDERDQKDMIGSIGSPNSIDAKKRALANFGSTAPPSHIGMLGMEEAIAIERRAHLHDLQRKHRLEQKKLDHGYPSGKQVMSREERERRVWAFMNYKPTESDLEDEDEEEEDGEGMDEDGEEDPSTWFEDDQDDGRKGQNIIEADEMDDRDMDGLRNVIRVMDPNQLRYGTFYEPRDD
ncbi:hypothetical protein GGU10DRAFT_383175 [Lentinula aff. detonsa]|uniref:Uncharacterized protein n=1 Tax=Lentinula aff. detonsa TaxID=2804958 RepID=A0AA38NSQ9_9AGAR|nr:hypothetical protein GGU10DRAFT_383175 [Lentinula aff. detonsa]